MPITVLLADDHEVVRQGLRAILVANTGFHVVGEAADGLEAVRSVERLRPNVIVLDLMMPGLNGLDALRIIRQRSPETWVVVLSMQATGPFVAEAFRCGASAYVLKGGKSSDLVTAIHSAAAGRRFLSPPLSEQSIAHYLAIVQSTADDTHELLTPREREVFHLAAEGKTSPQIGIRLHLSERTVERHRANLMQKLGLRTQTDLVHYALRRGLLLTDGDETGGGRSN
jgi:two-component system, NarL family, response regulator NreC